MTIQQFIEKAVAGGWQLPFSTSAYGQTASIKDVFEKLPTTLIRGVFLDPEAWKAVGKVEGWGAAPFIKDGSFLPETQHRMLGMVMALWDGKTIEQYLETL